MAQVLLVLTRMNIVKRGDRQSIRFPEYDYSQEGGYFITICTHKNRPLFGKIINEALQPTKLGDLVQQAWINLPNQFPNIETDEFIIMPNHLHGIIIVGADLVSARPCQGADTRPAPTVGNMSCAFKSKCVRDYIEGIKNCGWPRFNAKIWQRNFYEHIIRNDRSLYKIREYIINNPLRWELDRENPNRRGNDEFDDWLDGTHSKTVEPLTL